jgi:hypothetical protein
VCAAETSPEKGILFHCFFCGGHDGSQAFYCPFRKVFSSDGVVVDTIIGENFLEFGQTVWNVHSLGTWCRAACVHDFEVC